jgi:hypothetical protein
LRAGVTVLTLAFGRGRRLRRWFWGRRVCLWGGAMRQHQPPGQFKVRSLDNPPTRQSGQNAGCLQRQYRRTGRRDLQAQASLHNLRHRNMRQADTGQQAPGGDQSFGCGHAGRVIGLSRPIQINEQPDAIGQRGAKPLTGLSRLIQGDDGMALMVQRLRQPRSECSGAALGHGQQEHRRVIQQSGAQDRAAIAQGGGRIKATEQRIVADVGRQALQRGGQRQGGQRIGRHLSQRAGAGA